MTIHDGELIAWCDRYASPKARVEKGAVVAGRNAGIDQCQRRDRSAERADVLADREGASKQVERHGVETGPTEVDAGQDPFQTNGERLNARCLVDSSGTLEGKATELIDDRRA